MSPPFIARPPGRTHYSPCSTQHRNGVSKPHLKGRATMSLSDRSIRVIPFAVALTLLVGCGGTAEDEMAMAASADMPSFTAISSGFMLPPSGITGTPADNITDPALSIVLPLVQCRAPPWRHLDANPRAGPLRERRSGHCRQEIRAPRSMGRSSRTLRQRCAEAQTAPGGRLHQSSHPFPHHTGHCSLINPVECPIVVDRFRSLRDLLGELTIVPARHSTETVYRSPILKGGPPCHFPIARYV